MNEPVCSAGLCWFLTNKQAGGSGAGMEVSFSEKSRGRAVSVSDSVSPFVESRSRLQRVSVSTKFCPVSVNFAHYICIHFDKKFKKWYFSKIISIFIRAFGECNSEMDAGLTFQARARPGPAAPLSTSSTARGPARKFWARASPRFRLI